jgi:hypothetical protein
MCALRCAEAHSERIDEPSQLGYSSGITERTEAEMTTVTALRTIAEQAHATYPQYAGHWGGWELVTVTRQIRTKLGVAFTKGEVALRQPGTATEKVCPPRGSSLPYEQWPEREFVTLYSVRNRCDTLVQASYVRSRGVLS